VAQNCINTRDLMNKELAWSIGLQYVYTTELFMITDCSCCLSHSISIAGYLFETD